MLRLLVCGRLFSLLVSVLSCLGFDGDGGIHTQNTLVDFSC